MKTSSAFLFFACDWQLIYEKALWSRRVCVAFKFLVCVFSLNWVSSRENGHSVKKGVDRQHTTFTSCQNAACSNNLFSFSLTGRLCSGGKRCDWSNVIFAAYYTERSWHAYWFSVVIVSGRHDLPSDARAVFLWPLLKCKVLHCG